MAKLQPDSYVLFAKTNTEERAATMSLREILTREWWRIQDDLFPAAEEYLGPLSEKHRALIVVLETVCVERFLPYVHGLVGRPLAERTALARAFIVKAVFNIPTTRLLMDLLQGDIRLRRLCGWERVTDIPSEATFSRGFAEFAEQSLPARIHESLIKATLGQTIVGHIARDSTAIEAREKPVSKPKPEKAMPRKRGRRRKGDPAPIPEPTRIEQQKNMTLAAMLTELPKACDVGTKCNASGHQESWIGYKLHIDTADGDIPISALLTSASPHDSQVAIPLATMTAQRVINLYDLMDSAYDNNNIETFRIIESSTKGYRPEFERMIEFIGKQKQRTALIVDCVDRLNRSFTHHPVMNALMEKDLLEIHFVREGYSIDKDANSMQKLMWNMGTVMAQSYTDQLKDNIKRSIKHKIDSGHWIAKAPVGYRHEPDPQGGRSKIVIDESRALLVQRMFMEYATGTMSLRELQRRTVEWGLRSDKGNNLTPQTVCDIIKNPFYYGVMQIKGKLYRHCHPTLIEKGLYDLCQTVNNRAQGRPWKAVKETRKKFLLRGLVTCAVSGKKATCDLKKGRYTYLMVRDPASPERKLWVKEESVIKQIAEVIRSIAIPEKYLPEILNYIRSSHEAEKAFHLEHARSLQQEKNAITTKINRLTDLMIEGHVTEETYKAKHLELDMRRENLNRDMTGTDRGDSGFKITLSGIIALMAQAPQLFASSNITEKRALIGLVFSNLQLEGSTLRYTLRKPIDTFAKAAECQEWCPRGHLTNAAMH